MSPLSTAACRKMIGYVSLAVTLAAVGKIVWTVDDWGRDWSSNHASLESTASNPDLRPLHLNVTPDQARQQILAWAAAAPLWSVQSEERAERSDASGPLTPDGSAGSAPRITIHLTRRTRWLRFVDDIHVTLECAEADSPGAPATRVWAESQSRIGQGDLGQNPRNLIELTRGLNQAMRAADH